MYFVKHRLRAFLRIEPGCYINPVSCSSCTVFLDFFSTASCTCVRQVSIYSSFCSVARVFHISLSLSSRPEKKALPRCTLRSIFYFTIRDVFGAEWKGRVCRCHSSKKKPSFEFVSLSSLHTYVRTTAKSTISILALFSLIFAITAGSMYVLVPVNEATH